MMVLNGDAINTRNIVENTVAHNFRNASYDLRIGKIITLTGEEVIEYIMPAQGMAEVISAETVRLPDDVAGYALVKTSLCNQGVLALNIGIIDPGYAGLISSTLINFGKNPFVLRKDDVFLRLTFHEYQPQAQVARVMVGDADYVADKKDKVRKHFSERFLDVENTVAEVTKPVMERVLDEWKKGLVWWVPMAAFGFALLSFFVNWGATWSARSMLLTKEQLKTDVVADLRSQQVTALEERLRNLEEQLKQATPRVPPAGQQQPKASSTPKPRQP